LYAKEISISPSLFPAHPKKKEEKKLTRVADEEAVLYLLKFGMPGKFLLSILSSISIFKKRKCSCQFPVPPCSVFLHHTPLLVVLYQGTAKFELSNSIFLQYFVILKDACAHKWKKTVRSSSACLGCQNSREGLMNLSCFKTFWRTNAPF
jgi:hypothetical protein